MEEKSWLCFIQGLLVYIFGSLFKKFDKLYDYLEKYNIFIKQNKKIDRFFLAILVLGAPTFIILNNKFHDAQYLNMACVCLVIGFINGFLKGTYICLNSVSLSVLALTFFNLLISFFIYTLLYENTKEFTSLWILGIIIYALFWILYSMIAKSKIAKLSNEIITGIFAFLFTVVSFWLSLVNDYQFTNVFHDVDNTFNTQLEQDYLLYIVTGNSFAKDLQRVSGYLLVVVGLSAFLVVITSIRMHWEEKYRDKATEQ